MSPNTHQQAQTTTKHTYTKHTWELAASRMCGGATGTRCMSGMWMATGTRYRLGCVDGDGLVAGEGPVSGECKSVAAGHAGRGWRDSLKVRCVWMAMESLQGRVYEWRRDRGGVDGGPMDGGRTRLTMHSFGGAALDTACHKLHLCR